MAKLDRLVWASGASLTACGLRIGIRVNDADILERVLQVVPPLCRHGRTPTVERLYSLVAAGVGTRPGVRRFHLLYAGPVLLARTTDLEEAIAILESDLKLYVAERARRRLFVHAGVVGWNGKALVIPGPSFSGKSTLVAALVRAGATYLSDEYAVIDSRDQVHPYLAPLTLRGDSTALPAKYPSATLPDLIGAKPLPIGLVVLTRYGPESRWHPRLLSHGRSVLGLLAHTVAARSLPKPALTRLTQVLRFVPVYAGVRGEVEETAGPLLGMIRDSSAE